MSKCRSSCRAMRFKVGFTVEDMYGGQRVTNMLYDSTSGCATALAKQPRKPSWAGAARCHKMLRFGVILGGGNWIEACHGRSKADKTML